MPSPVSKSSCIILTDLDGCLLDASSYSYEPATEALQRLRDAGIPIVLVSSKTRAEIEPLRLLLDNRHPFVVENGGGIFIPSSYFPFAVEGATDRGTYQVVELGLSYARIREALKEIERAVGFGLTGFGDMSTEDVARHTGLPFSQALLAKQREFDEPFLCDFRVTLEMLRPHLQSRGLRCTKGGRFHHLMGATDKGRASRLLLEWYRRQPVSQEWTLFSIGLGDSLNDLPMLETVDRPILVQKLDGSYDPDVRLPHVYRAAGKGPVGWNRAVLEILHEL